MSQHPVLTLVLGLVLIGFAVYVGLETSAENQRKANSEDLIADAIRIASDVQAWKLKPAAFDGGAEAVNWEGLTLEKLGYQSGMSSECDPGEFGNEHGCFGLSGQHAETVVIKACNPDFGNQVTIYVSGPGEHDVSTVISANGCW